MTKQSLAQAAILHHAVHDEAAALYTIRARPASYAGSPGATTTRALTNDTSIVYGPVVSWPGPVGALHGGVHCHRRGLLGSLARTWGGALDLGKRGWRPYALRWALHVAAQSAA